MFVSLLAGATLVLRGPVLWSAREFGERVRSLGVTVADLPLAYWQEIAAEAAGGEGALPTVLRLLLVGGEALPPSAARAGGGTRLVNGYGPTEAVVTATAFEVPPGFAGARVPIGRPLSGHRAYVLDSCGELVPPPVAGELCLGGPLLARGYLGRPGLTAERFVPDPFAGVPGARMYRTGDRARWRADGNLEFLGRTDFQVKLRGFRVEPGEIEARLSEHPAVRQAVVLVRDDAPGDRRLVAYCVAEGPVDAESLRAHLAARLPSYMVPAAFVLMEAFPVSTSGKVDRAALPAPGGDAYATHGYEAPVGETEAALAEIWAEVLGVERVGRHDHFFERGGHSLRAVQVISRVRQVLRVEAALGELFTRPVLSDFARALETAARAELPPIERTPREGRIPLSFAQQRLWFLEQLGGLGSAYHLAERLRLRGELDRAALGRALDAIVARHESLRTTFAEMDGVPEQRIAPADTGFQLAEHDLGGGTDAKTELRRLEAREVDAPFDLERGPLIRGRLVRLAADDHVLLLTMHHIVSDGWSMEVLTRELSALYAAHREGREAALPVLPVQYADYAVWQRRWVEGEILHAQAEYWTAALAGAPELLELPTDRPRPARVDHAGALLGVVLDETLTAGLKALGRRHGTTLFMTLLAGWAAVLGRLSGQGDVVIGTPTAGRGRREIEGLIGFFVNTLALRLDLSDAPAVAELLGRAKERALEAQHHQDIPFEQVVERVDPVRSLAHHPLFQVMFSWQNAPDGDADLPGPAAAAQPGAPPATAKFDLSLALAERGGRIVGSLTFATALFEESTAERWLGYLRRALEEMAADEAQPVDRLALLSAGERRLLLEEWNRTEAAEPGESCVHELFEVQARRTPGTAALLSHGGGALTYAELNAAANGLARRLRAAGVGPERAVGVMLERSAELVVALLAVLKAGGAYLPLDPALPAARRAALLADAGAPVLVTRDPRPEGFTGTLVSPADAEGE
ncbi:MAG TPA: condensation domain-containing protein, partial [Longimicrobium sp.]|nr:condensation domain-containing protein [Longimicrobium sp.]